MSITAYKINYFWDEITELNKITLIFTKLKMEIPRSRKKIIGSKVIVYFPLIVCLAKGHLKAYMCYTNSSPLKSYYWRFTTLIL